MPVCHIQQACCLQTLFIFALRSSALVQVADCGAIHAVVPVRPSVDRKINCFDHVCSVTHMILLLCCTAVASKTK